MRSALVGAWLPRRRIIFAAISGPLLALLVPVAAAIWWPLPYVRQSGTEWEYGTEVHTATCTRIIAERWAGEVAVGTPVVPRWARQRLEHRVGGDFRTVAVDGRGWPWRGMCVSGLLSSGTVESVEGGVLTPDWLARSKTIPVMIPLRPIWPGLLGNFAVFTLAIAVPGVLARIIRRAWRYERGRCPDCGYERRGRYDTPCSECGS